MRRRKPAPHGFAVNGNLNKIKRFDYRCTVFAARPPATLGTMRAGLQFTSRSLAPRGLADYNPRSASPSDVWANDSAYHNTPPKVVAKRETAPSFRSKCIARNQQDKPPSLFRVAACVRLVMALFPVSLAQAGTYPHGWYSLFKLQGERFFFPVHPIAQEKGRNLSAYKKFLIFS